MLPVANLHLKDLYDTTVEFFALRSPTLYFRGTDNPDPESSNSRNLTPVPDPIARLTRECASLRERLDAADGRHYSTCPCHSSSSSGLTLPPMRRELDVTRNELARSQMEVAKLEERCKMLEKTLRETKEMLRVRDAEMEKIRREKERPTVDRRRSDASQKNNIYGPIKEREDNQNQRQGPADLTNLNGVRNGRYSEEETAHTLKMFDEERAQARSLELFLTRTDSWSGAQVLQAVHDLNSEILQFAASATELCIFDRDSRLPPTRSAQAVHDTTARLGPHLVHILSTRDHTQDPILVQFALQGCISTCVSRALSTFCVGFPSKSDAVLSQIYARMYVAEPQSTSSRWRSLAHRHIHTLYPTLEEFAINDVVETIFRWSSDIFTIAGCASLESSSRDGLRARFGEQVRRIARSVSKLAQVTREEIMSTNFDIVAVEHAESFDPQQMSDAFGDYGISRGHILATTELGLRCTTRKSAEFVKEDDGVIERRLLLRPKVVLESVLDVLDPR